MLRDSGTPHILLMLCLYWVLYNHYVINETCINPLALGNFAEKHILKQVELFSGYCFTGGALCGPLFQMPNISFQLQSLGISTERKIFRFGCKSDTAVSTFTFCFL